MSEIATIIPGFSGGGPKKSQGFAATISRNIVASLARVAAVSLVALVLPAYLTHHLPVTTYAAWVLILQLAAYVSYLDLGIQTGVSKFVAEFEARGDEAGAGRYASAGLVLMILAGALGVILTLLLAWQVPRLFATMPSNLYRDVRISVILVGSSLSFALVCAVYSAVFLGLQRYWIPMTISIVNRASYAAIVLVVVALHGNLTAMGIAVAAVNIVTGLLQVIAWRKKASNIRVSIRLTDARILKTVVRYCSMQSILTAAMLCITGLDITIVGHYDYVQTAYYSIATLPTSFVLLIISSMVNPLMPASSAMSTQRSPSEMGDFLARITRYSTIILLLTGLPLMVCGFPILRVWVGPVYALHTLQYLRVLVFANVIRNLCAPYATMICATGRQGAAAISAISEAVVNLGSSIYLASRFGAIGVALGTVLGSLVGVSLHFAISMHLTHQTLAISRLRLFLKGLLRPAVIAIPSLVFLPLWWSTAHITLSLRMFIVWSLSTLLLAWFGGLSRKERVDLVHFSRKGILALSSSG
ncbi:MAG: polysaccharide biosynthesis C-terminal domain-containing protein [Candidatus Sulfotelmatobacter sp.]